MDDRDVPRLVTAEWALWGKEGGDTAYRVLRCSDGVFSRDDFRAVILRYASGVKHRLPQYTVCWIPDTPRHPAYLGVAVHELADPDPSRSGGRSRIAGGQEVEYVRLFCVPYAEMAKLAAGYPDLAEAVMECQLPAGETAPLLVALRPAAAPRPVAAKSRMLAENVAALLLTTRPVCVLGAEEVRAEDRLWFIELVMSLLPYGMRSRLSASTLASPTAQRLNVRLYFASTPRDDAGKTSYVTWGEPGALRLGGEHEAIGLYLEWLRRAGQAAAPELAQRSMPLRFTPDDVGVLVRDLPRDRRVTQILENLADGLRDGAGEPAIGLSVALLRRHLASPHGAVGREASREVIFRRGLLKDHGNLSQGTQASLYQALILLAFATPLTYDSYCEIEQAVGGPPRGTLRTVLLGLKFASFIPWVLVAKSEPTFRARRLTSDLARGGVAPTTPIDELAKLTRTVRAEHCAVVYDFAAHYLRTAQDPVRELRCRGYLAEILEAIFPGDLRAQRTRLTETLRFAYGARLSQGQVEDLFVDPAVYPTTALEQAVRDLARPADNRLIGRLSGRRGRFHGLPD